MTLTARRLQRHFNAEVLARCAVAPLWAAAAVFAASVLVIRDPTALALAGALASAGAVVAAAWRFRQLAWTERQALIALDRAGHAGGLALALHERPAAEWDAALRAKLASASLPPRAFGRPVAACVAAVAFAVGAAFVPPPQRATAPVQQAAVAHVEDATARAEQLAAEGQLDDALKAELERLRAESAHGTFDASDWAALDAVDESLRQSAAAREAQLAAAAEAAAKLAEVAEANAGRDAEQRAREELESALAQLGDAATPSPGAETKKLSGAGKQLARNSRELQRALENRAAQMRQGQGKGADGQAGGKRPGPPGHSGDSPQDRGLTEAGQSRPGEQGGAPARGPGAAPVTFGEETPLQLDRLRADPFQGRDHGDLDQLMGLSALPPEAGDAKGSGATGAAPSGPEGVAPQGSPIAPRHRELLRRYFDTGGKR